MKITLTNWRKSYIAKAVPVENLTQAIVSVSMGNVALPPVRVGPDDKDIALAATLLPLKKYWQITATTNPQNAFYFKHLNASMLFAHHSVLQSHKNLFFVPHQLLL